MARTLKIRKPTAVERRRLQAILEETTDKHIQRRAETILLYADGLQVGEIAQVLHAHPNTVYADLHAFDQLGLRRYVQPLARGGAPPRITPAQREEIWQLADQTPGDFGLPYGRWTLTTFQNFLIRRHIIKRISLGHLHRLLGQGKIRFQRVRRKLISQDPQRRAILRQIKYVFTHLPPDGVLLFFDVQPIAVKAYGGRRFSSAKRLVLDRRQKIRGYFYLFVAYDATSGRVYWRYYYAKNADCVCQFMHWVRQWFPKQEVWIVLDQDPAHPRKAYQTRRVMRALQLHWISLPKASPDDNPVETIFSHIQQFILDNSNDPDERTTRRRISRYLSNRNRRRDRTIQMSYLQDSHKG